MMIRRSRATLQDGVGRDGGTKQRRRKRPGRIAGPAVLIAVICPVSCTRSDPTLYDARVPAIVGHATGQSSLDQPRAATNSRSRSSSAASGGSQVRTRVRFHQAPVGSSGGANS